MSEILKKIAEARRREFPVEGINFNVTLPHRLDIRRALINAQVDGKNDYNQAKLNICTKSVTGWAGVTNQHFNLPGKDAIDFDVALVGEFFGHQPKVMDALSDLIMHAVEAREKQVEEAIKN